MDSWGIPIAGSVLATVPSGETPVSEVGIVVLVALLVIRESFALVRHVMDRKRRLQNGGYSDHDLLTKLDERVKNLSKRLDHLER